MSLRWQKQAGPKVGHVMISPHPSLNWSSAITIEFFWVFFLFFFLSIKMATVVRDLSAPLVLFFFSLDSDPLPACVVLCFCCYIKRKFLKKLFVLGFKTKSAMFRTRVYRLKSFFYIAYYINFYVSLHDIFYCVDLIRTF